MVYTKTRLIIFFAAKDGETLYSQQKQDRELTVAQVMNSLADCGSGHELLIAKLRLKLKEVVKTTRAFRYDLNQIPYDYKVEVTNGVKGLDLIDRVPEELWMEVYDTVQEAMAKTIPKGKQMQKSKMVV